MNPNEAKYQFVYENRWIGLAFVVISYFLILAFITFIGKLYDFGWGMSVFGLALFLPWILCYFIPDIYSYNAYCIVTNDGIEIQSRFRNYYVRWDEISQIYFDSNSYMSSKNRGLHINCTDFIKSIHFLDSKKDKRIGSLYSFYEVLKERYSSFLEERSLKSRHEK